MESTKNTEEDKLNHGDIQRLSMELHLHTPPRGAKWMEPDGAPWGANPKGNAPLQGMPSPLSPPPALPWLAGDGIWRMLFLDDVNGWIGR